MRTLPWLALLFACNGEGDGSDGKDDTEERVDADDDGSPQGEDCNDLNAAIHPGATEVCDPADVDEDCDGLADTSDPDAAGRVTVYHDTDADGFGDPNAPSEACESGAGYVTDDTDCDDTDPRRNPGFPEICDDADRDEDCDLLADDADDSVAPSRVAYEDADGDTYGNLLTSDVYCDVPAGWVEDFTDCDDNAASIHPDALESCNGADDDCDLVVDEEAVDAEVFWVDADLDEFGDPAQPVAACTRPFGTVANDDDCFDGDDAVNPAAAERCNGVDDDCDLGIDEDPIDPATFWTDADGDGFGAGDLPVSACVAPPGTAVNDGDCDDGLAEVNPAADEVCDPVNRDEDCSGVADDDDPNTLVGSLVTWFHDVDGDGYGITVEDVTQCDAPGPAWATEPGDCDDDEPLRNPGASEVCDLADLDEDCDGDADDDDGGIDPASLTVWYRDIDGDGYGSTPQIAACERPVGYDRDGGDCAEGDIDVNPGAVEVCDPSDVDEDCDALAEDADPTLDPASATTWYADVDGDGWGDDATAVAACARPPGAITRGGDCTDTDPSTFPGAPDVCQDGIDRNCDGYDTCVLYDFDAVTTFEGGNNDWFGIDVRAVGDVTGDGLPDVMVVADENNGSFGPYAWVWSGPAGVETRATAALSLVADVSDHHIGVLEPLGDIDADGVDDLLIGGPWADSDLEGAVYLMNGPLVGGQMSGSFTARWAGSGFTEQAGSALAAPGDVDANGVADTWLGSGRADANGNASGAVYLVPVDTPSGPLAAVAAATVTGVSGGDQLGACVAAPGDVDGDGLPDLVAGAPFVDQAPAVDEGRLYVWTAPPVGTTDASTADFTYEGTGGFDSAGSRCAGAADATGDGLADVLAGSGTGVALVPGSFPSGPLAGVPTRFEGAPFGGGDGTLAGGRDVDGDGLGDVVLGEPAAGAAWLFFGGSAGVFGLLDADTAMVGPLGVGDGLDLAPDLTGDGVPDVLASSIDADFAWLWSGADL